MGVGGRGVADKASEQLICMCRVLLGQVVNVSLPAAVFVADFFNTESSFGTKREPLQILC